MKEAGYSTVLLARDMQIRRSSRGWRITSSTVRLNSEQHPIVSQRYFTWLWGSAAAHQCHVAYGVVRIAEWTLGHKPLAVGQAAYHRVDFVGFQRFA